MQKKQGITGRFQMGEYNNLGEQNRIIFVINTDFKQPK